MANNTNPTKLDDGTDGFGGASIGILKGGTNGYVGNHIVAIEIDTFQITGISDRSASRVGLDINSLISIQACDICLFFSPSYFDSGETFAISIDYSKNNETLHVIAQLYNKSTNCLIELHNFTLLDVLVDDGYIYVGSFGGTRNYYEVCSIYSWYFSISGLPNFPTSTPTSPTLFKGKKKHLCGILFMGVGILGVIFFLKMKSQKGLHVVELVQWHTT